MVFNFFASIMNNSLSFFLILRQRIFFFFFILTIVLLPKEYSKSHYVKSINIPFNNLFAKKDKLGDFESQIIVYGKSFNKSYEAKKVLKSMGFKNVFVAGTLKDMLQIKEKEVD